MATNIYLQIAGVQGDCDVPGHVGSISVSTFELRGPTGGWEPVGFPDELRGPTGGVSPSKPGNPGTTTGTTTGTTPTAQELRGPTGGVVVARSPELIVTISGGEPLAAFAQSFASGRPFATGTLTVDQEAAASIVLRFTTLVVTGVSGINDEEGAEYQVTFAYVSVS